MQGYNASRAATTQGWQQPLASKEKAASTSVEFGSVSRSESQTVMVRLEPCWIETPVNGAEIVMVPGSTKLAKTVWLRA